MNHVEDRMEESNRVVKKDLASMRAGRVPCCWKECQTTMEFRPINQSIINRRCPSRTFVISRDKNLLGNIEKAIQRSDLGAMPVNDGNVIRVTIPPLSGDRRRELIKALKKDSEAQKVSLRNIRRSAMDEIKQAEKDKEISEDLSRRIQTGCKNSPMNVSCGRYYICKRGRGTEV